MNLFKFDATEMLMPDADELGHKIGEYVPKLFARLSEVLKSRGLPHELPKTVEEALPRLIKLAAGGTEISLGILPAGQVRDVAEKYLNTILDNVGKGAADKLAAGGDKPTDKGDGKKDDGKKTVHDRLDPDQPVYIIDGSPYPVSCSHRQPFARKGEGKPTPITLREAVRRGHMPHDLCIGSSEEIWRLIAAMSAPAAEPDDPKPEPKDDEHAVAPKEHPLPTADHTLFDLWQRLHDDVLEHDGSDLMYRAKWDEFVRCTEQDPELRGKFLTAFTRRGSYRQFQQLVLEADSGHWHHHLDNLLGESKPTASFLKRKAAEEMEQWKRAVKGITAWLKRSNVAGQEAIDQDDAKIDRLKAIYHGVIVEGQDGSEVERLKKIFPAARVAGRSSIKGWLNTIVLLAILLVTIFIIGHIS